MPRYSTVHETMTLLRKVAPSRGPDNADIPAPNASHQHVNRHELSHSESEYERINCAR